MKTVSIKEFRDHATQHLRTSEPLIIMRGSSPAGIFLPWNESLLTPHIVKRVIYNHLTHPLQKDMEQSALSEEEVLADFAAYRNNCH